MYISRQNARSIVDEMKTAIHRDINIMDENGVILASTNPVRQGQVHQGALRIIRENLPSLVIRRDAPEEGVQQGINLPVTIGGRLEGVIGITGDPDEVSAFGDVIKRMTEILLENLQRQEQQALLERAKSLFGENWLFSDEPEVFPALAASAKLRRNRIGGSWRPGAACWGWTSTPPTPWPSWALRSRISGKRPGRRNSARCAAA